jgi:hypothetical protein
MQEAGRVGANNVWTGSRVRLDAAGCCVDSMAGWVQVTAALASRMANARLLEPLVLSLDREARTAVVPSQTKAGTFTHSFSSLLAVPC